MKKFKQWLYELFHPSVKCNRVGHVERVVLLKFYEWPSRSMGIADEVHYEGTKCSRCRRIIFGVEMSRSVVNSLIMSSKDWRKLRTEGRLPK